MPVVVLGAGAVGVATAWYLRKAGHDVTVVERQNAAALETSWGNGGVIHASEVEPWSQPGMPLKILKWLGQENAPLLLRYGAIPHMWRWGLAFARNCNAGEVRGQFARQSGACALFAALAAGDRRRDRHRLRSRHQRRPQDLPVEGVARQRGARLRRAGAHRAQATSGSTWRAASALEPALDATLRHAGGGALFRARRGGRLQQVHAGPGRGVRGARRALPLRDDGRRRRGCAMAA